MTSRDVADAVAVRRKISSAEACETVAEVLDVIAAGIAEGDLALAGFGVFSKSHHGTRAGRNPRTDEALFIRPSRRMHFRPGKALRNRVGR